MTPKDQDAPTEGFRVYESEDAMAEAFAAQEAAFLREYGEEEDDDAGALDAGAPDAGALDAGALDAVRAVGKSLDAVPALGADEWMTSEERRARMVEDATLNEPPAMREEPGAGDPGLYVGRPLENIDELQAWADQHGIALAPSPHVTLVYSDRSAVSSVVEHEAGQWRTWISPRDFTHIAPLGPKGAVVLHLRSRELASRHRALLKGGARSMYRTPFLPHLTLTYQGDRINWSRIPLPDFPLVLGPERHGPLDGDVFAKMAPEAHTPQEALVIKALGVRARLEARTPHIIEALRRGMGAETVRKAAALRYAMGWASVVSDANGKILRDRQGDVMRLADIQKSARAFFDQAAPTGGLVHMRMPDGAGGDRPVRIGTVIEGLVVTPVVKAVLDLPDDTPHGLAITMHVTSDAAWEAVERGVFKAFSIHGKGWRTPIRLPKDAVVE